MKIEVNKKNMTKLVTALGLSGVITLGTIGAGPFINPSTNFVDFYYINTKNFHLSSEDFLDRFNKIYNSSPKLQEQWKDIYPELSAFLLKYGDQLDQEEILDTLEKLKFVTVNYPNSNFFAVTQYKKNQITYNDSLFYKKDSEIKEIKLHEAFHYLFQQHLYGSFLNFLDIGLQLDEGTADILTKESNAYVGLSQYEKNSTYVKVLCEIIGTDKFLAAQGDHDWLKLIDYIGEYCSNHEALFLLKNIDKACTTLIDNSFKPNDYDKKAWKIINKMFLNKNGISIEDSKDDIMKVYSNYLTGTTYKILGARNSIHASVSKRYFINTEENPIIELIYFDKKYGELYVDENNSICGGHVLENYYYNDDGETVDSDGNLVSDNELDLGISFNK